MAIKQLKNTLYPRAQRFVARNRRAPLLRKLALYSDVFRAWYRNLDGDVRFNGERRVLEVLRGRGLRTVFDVGANVGEWSALARSVFPEATVHAFEIVGPTSAKLQEKFRGDAGVVVNPFGLSEAAGELEIRYFPEDDTLSTLIDYPHPGQPTILPARVVAGDEYVRESGVERIDYLKMDVEGAEHLVLRGLEGTFREGRVSAVQFEYGTVNILTRFLLRDFHEFFSARGFRVGKIYPTYVDFREYSFDQEDFLGQNYLAVSAARADWIEALGR
ncbi:MAG: FkbM family methyltransferase [Gemmatimonadota bacterium]